MKRKLPLLALTFIFAISACSNQATNNSDAPTETTDTPSIEVSKSVEESLNNVLNTTKRTLVSGVYTVGDNLEPAQYALTCTKSDYAMKVVVFEGKEHYDAYYREERITNGQESAAIEQYALFDFYIKPDKTNYLGLNDGYIVMVESGEGEMEEVSPDESSTESAIFSGIYFVGKDLVAGQYNFKCIETDYSLQIVIFDNISDYSNYHKTSRWTNGEETEAIQQYSSNSTYIRVDDSYFLDLKEGAVLMVQNGTGSLSTI